MKLSESWKVQVWFCVKKLDQCVLRLGAKWILNYLNIPDKWPVKSRTRLTLVKVTSFEFGRFVLEDKEALKDPTLALVRGILDDKDSTNVDVTPCEVLKNVFFYSPEISLKFVPSHFVILGIPDLI